MPVAKVNSFSGLDLMKSVGKPEEGNDSLDNFIRQAIGKEPVNSFSRAGDSPVQWIQLLHALDQQGTNKLSKGSKLTNAVDGKSYLLERCNGVSSFASETNGVKESFHPIKSSGVPVKGMKSASEQMQTLKIPEAVVAFAQAAAKANGEPEKYLPGWPLLSPPKVQMQKCDKCNREFCSPINYRRHIRVHRRSLNIDKDFPKNRDFLGAYWDKLSLDEAKEIVSFNNVELEEVPGSAVVKALTSFIRKPGFSSLPQVYVKAGAALLDVVQTKPPRFPISSHELFSIFDDASERTFLCAGTALSLQKFVFNGEAGKIGLEMRNLVACTSFLVEQKLVEAWLADKDAEALRCQKMLVAEEEAAQKRQAELLERKRLKKLRQKEQKAKEHMDGDDLDFKEGSLDSLEGETSAANSMLPALDSHSHTQKSPPDPAQQSLEPVKLANEVEYRCDSEFDDVQIDMVSGIANSINCQNVDNRLQQGSSRWRRPVSSSRRGAPNGFHLVQIHQFSKLGPVQKHGIHRDQRATTLVNGHKVWTRKTKPDNEGEDLNGRVQRELRDQSDEKESEVLIGSISVMLGDCNGCSQGDIMCGLTHQFAADGQSELTRSKNAQVPVKTDSLQSGISRTRLKHWRPVGKQEAGSLAPNIQREANLDRDHSKPAEQSVGNERSVPRSTINDCRSVNRTDSSIGLEEVTDQRGPRLFCSREAEAFLTQRWKEAIASDHVKLVSSPEVDPPDGFETQDDDARVALPANSDCCDPSILCSANNQLSNLDPHEHSAWGATKAKFRAKPEKGGRLKYIPKQRNNT